MHELSVALRIVESLDAELEKEGELEVTSVSIRVGALTSVVPEALQFAWGHATGESRLRGSQLEIDWVEAEALCPDCATARTITNLQSFRCPVCGSPLGAVVGGTELEVVSLDVRDVGPDQA